MNESTAHSLNVQADRCSSSTTQTPIKNQRSDRPQIRLKRRRSPSVKAEEFERPAKSYKSAFDSPSNLPTEPTRSREINIPGNLLSHLARSVEPVSVDLDQFVLFTLMSQDKILEPASKLPIRLKHYYNTMQLFATIKTLFPSAFPGGLPDNDQIYVVRTYTQDFDGASSSSQFAKLLRFDMEASAVIGDDGLPNVWNLENFYRVKTSLTSIRELPGLTVYDFSDTYHLRKEISQRDDPAVIEYHRVLDTIVKQRSREITSTLPSFMEMSISNEQKSFLTNPSKYQTSTTSPGVTPNICEPAGKLVIPQDRMTAQPPYSSRAGIRQHVLLQLRVHGNEIQGIQDQICYLDHCQDTWQLCATIRNMLPQAFPLGMPASNEWKRHSYAQASPI